MWNCKPCTSHFVVILLKMDNVSRFIYLIITARVRSTTGRLCFDTCLSVCLQGGCQVQPAGGGVRSSQWGGVEGVRSSRGGVRYSRRGGGGQVQPEGGGSGPAGGGGGSAKIGQHREYLLHGGRYASCVHAGGLSCIL